MYQLGIDLGGTKIEGVVLDHRGHELFRQRIPTEQEKGYGHITKNIKTLYNLMVRRIPAEEHTLGIGTPGAISHKTGLLKNSNTLCLNNRPLKKDLERILDKVLVIENDANCFALAEALLGAGKGHPMVFGVIMGTGCGGGVVYNGKMITGRQSIAGEWGHMSIDPAGSTCYCGAQGCVETFISGGGLERQYNEKFDNGHKLADIIVRYRNGVEGDVKFIEEFFVNFGRAMANLINILDPDIIVLGGGLSNIDELYNNGVKEVEKRIFSDSFETSIVKNMLGDSAGVIGAALVGNNSPDI